MKLIRKILTAFKRKKNHDLLGDILNSLLKGDWAVGLDDLQVLEQELHRFIQYPKINVLEFGTGASSLFFLKYFTENNISYQLDIVEEDVKWITVIKNHLRKIKIANHLNFYQISYNQSTGLDEAALNLFKNNDYEIVFIDAPPDTSVVNGRYKLAKIILNKIKPNGILIIHDSKRNMEMFAVEKLKPQFLNYKNVNTAKGLTIFYFPKDINNE